MKKIFVFLALLCFAAALSAQVVYIRGSKLMLRYGSENYSVELKGDSIEINGTSFIKMARLFGGDSLLIGNDTVYRGGFYVTDTLGATSFRALGDTLIEGAGGGSGIDTGYVKTTGDSIYGYYAHVGDFVFNNMDNIATNGSVAFGNGTDATGVNSAAFGMDAAASGDLSFAAGESSASGYESAAFNTSNAIGDGSFSINSGFSYGTNTFSANQAYAKSYFSTAVGAWNDSTTYTSKTNWILADPLFQVGNGTIVALNDAFRILKNGKTYIGDMSSTTDPIMIVDPTDSTTTVIGTITTDHLVIDDTVTLADALAELDSITINELTIFPKDTAIADDGTIVMANGLFGFGEAFLFNAGTLDQYAKFYWNSDGSVVLLDYSMDVVNTDTDNKFCIFDNGSGITIRNRMGGARVIKLNLHY